MIHHGFLNAVWLIRKVDVQSKNTKSITCIEFILVHYYGRVLAINREIGDKGFYCVTNLIIEQSQFFSLTSTHPCTLSSAKKENGLSATLSSQIARGRTGVVSLGRPITNGENRCTHTDSSECVMARDF